jgi:hypothetical protein
MACSGIAFLLCSVVPTVWLAMAGPSKRARISDKAIERELCTDTESEEEVSIGDKSDEFPRHQAPSCSSEDSGDDE